MGEPLTMSGLYQLGEFVMGCIDDSLSRGHPIDEQDIEMLETIGDTLERKRVNRVVICKEADNA